jgi:hypothetical protein
VSLNSRQAIASDLSFVRGQKFAFYVAIPYHNGLYWHGIRRLGEKPVSVAAETILLMNMAFIFGNIA